MGRAQPGKALKILTRIRGRARRAVMGADSANTLDGQSRMAIGVTTYALPGARLMTEPEQKLTPAIPDDLANALSFALRFEGRKSQHDADRLNADIVAKRLVRCPRQSGVCGDEEATARGARSGGPRVWSEVT